MENDSWPFSKSTTSSNKFNFSDEYVEDDYEEMGEEYDDDDDGGGDDGDDVGVDVDFPCPFCPEDFDIVGLCCHIDDEHYEEAKKGVCPLCCSSVDNLVEHVALRHGNARRSRNKSRFSDSESQSSITSLKKELLDRTLKALGGSSSSVVSYSSVAADQLLTSFIGSFSSPAEAESKPSCSQADEQTKEELVDEKLLERSMQSCSLSEEKNEEKSQRCKFVQSLLLSTFLDDNL